MSNFIDASEKRIVPKNELLVDINQLAYFLESAHPDPYINGGGKIAFHRRLQHTLATIPESGMTVDRFYRHLLPFIASVGDGHTTLTNPTPVSDSHPGIPMEFTVINKKLAISAVYREKDRDLIGARLTKIEGIPLRELLIRQGKLKGFDNIYQNLTNLIDSLGTRAGLWSLIPSWKGEKIITLDLIKGIGAELSIDMLILEELPDIKHSPGSKIKLPSIQKQDFAFDFLDEDREIAILKIDGMMGYREAYEWFHKMGLSWTKRCASRIYRKFHGKNPPENVVEIIGGLPSATETFTVLFREMKEAGSKTLIVDLRQNRGGNSAMTQILLYFMYGKEKVLESMNATYGIKKYSKLFFSNYKNVNLAEINRDQEVTLTGSDYDFREEKNFFKQDNDTVKDDSFIDFLGQMPTFMAEFEKGTYEAYFLPENIIVLTSARTYSSGFSLAALMYKYGATIVGVPSAQAGNCFSDTLGFELTHSGLKGYLSHKRSIMFPDRPETGRILSPHYELTYDKFSALNFDSNSIVLLALEILPQLNRQ